MLLGCKFNRGKGKIIIIIRVEGESVLEKEEESFESGSGLFLGSFLFLRKREDQHAPLEFAAGHIPGSNPGSSHCSKAFPHSSHRISTLNRMRINIFFFRSCQLTSACR